jgi:outer membrane protein OmpA-like peptidoglycan-associated protein
VKQFVLFIIIIFLYYNISSSQDVLDREKTFYDAEFLVIYENYPEALPLYLKLIDSGLNNANINYKTGKAYLNIYRNKSKAIPYLETASKNISFKYRKESFREKRAPVETLLLLGEAYQINNELSKALDCYYQYKNKIEENKGNTDEVNRKINSCNNAITLKSNPVDYAIKTIPNINIGSQNYKPAVSGDGNRLVFMSTRRYYEAIFFAKKNIGTWTKPQNITMELESDGQFQCVSLSFDGTKLFLNSKPANHYELYESKYSSDRWGKIENLNKNINSPQDEVHACLSPNGKTLYFVSNRKEGFGGFDIYRSEADDNNEWGPAINLGPVINTPFNENTPFFSSDGQTIYFSSEGHYNIGGYDIFYSKKLENGSWTEPQNIGYPVNTTDDDLFYVPVQDKVLGYQSRIVPDETQKENIYEIEFYSEINPRKTEITGTVNLADNKNVKDTELKISLMNETYDDTLKVVYPETTTGQFSFEVPPGIYNVVFDGEGYVQKTKTLEIKELPEERIFTLSTTLEPLTTTEEEIYNIYSIFFNFDDYSLSKKSTKELDNICVILEKFKTINLQIIGHTDSKGTNVYNTGLSRKRAESAFNYLTEKGIEKNRLKSLGKSENNPIAVNQNPDGTDNPEGRKYNRRVDFSIDGILNKKIIIVEPDIPDNLRIK